MLLIYSSIEYEQPQLKRASTNFITDEKWGIRHSNAEVLFIAQRKYMWRNISKSTHELTVFGESHLPRFLVICSRVQD